MHVLSCFHHLFGGSHIAFVSSNLIGRKFVKQNPVAMSKSIIW